MQLIDGTIPVFGEADEKTLKQIRTCAKTADKVASMLTPEQRKSQQHAPAPGSGAHAAGSSQI